MNDKSQNMNSFLWAFERTTIGSLALMVGWGLFGYWSIGSVEILRVAWGLVQVCRVQQVYGLSLCGFAIGRLDLSSKAAMTLA